MTDDVQGDMNGMKRHRRFGLDRDTAERMFAGLSADDAPPNYAAVASLLAAVASVDGAAIDDVTVPGEHAAMRAYRDAMHAGARVRTLRRVQPWRTAAGRIAVFATASTLAIGGGVAAAATGSLPAPAQRVAHQILSGLGVPPASSHSVAVIHVRTSETVATSTTVSATPVQSTTAERPAARLVAAETSTPPASSTESTTEDNHGAAVSSVAHSAEPGPDHGAAVCFVASEGACLAGRESDSTDPDSTEQKQNGVAKGHHKSDDATDSETGDDDADSGSQGNGFAKGHHKSDDADSRKGSQKGNGAAKGHHRGSSSADTPRGNGAAKGHHTNSDKGQG
jgi:hypothetical protein